MVSLMYSLINLLFFDIPLLYHYTNLNSPIMCCLFSGDICLCFGISNNDFKYLSQEFSGDLLKLVKKGVCPYEFEQF